MNRLTGDRDPHVSSLGDAAAAALAEMRRPRLVRRAENGFDVLQADRPDFTYPLDDDVLRDAGSAMFWIRQLGAKTWCTKQHLIDLACAVLAQLETGAKPPPT